MTYKVDLASRRVERQIDDLPPDMQRRIIAVLRSLADTPRPFGVEKLMDDLHRIRVGQFRIIYRIALQQLRGPRDFLNREDAKSTKVLMFSQQLVAD
jgi:mRNA-degrading endonuclease RelE of RelBE toxin-antitoxin system